MIRILTRCAKRKPRQKAGFSFGAAGGIRTHGTLACTPDFECCPLNGLERQLGEDGGI